SGTTPARPLERAGEHALFPDLEVHVDRSRHCLVLPRPVRRAERWAFDRCVTTWTFTRAASRSSRGRRTAVAAAGGLRHEVFVGVPQAAALSALRRGRRSRNPAGTPTTVKVVVIRERTGSALAT